MPIQLKDKNIILGITGSIAAYKAPLIVRELIKLGANVRVVMTPAATNFVSPLSLKSVSKYNVAIEMFDDSLQSNGAWHVELAQWADLMIIAPCSAATLSKIATGNSETALVCVAMAMPREKPLIIAPAMDFDMWLHPATQNNARTLQSYGIKIIPPEDGELASGLVGPGRLPAIPVLIDEIIKSLDGKVNIGTNIDGKSTETEKSELKAEKYSPFDSSVENISESVGKDKWNAEMELEKLKSKLTGNAKAKLKGRKVLITAGPTIEQIDDVRFISNYSTGKMGYAIAKAALDEGAEVTIISGPVNIPAPEGAKIINVQSAEQMFEATINEFANSDIAVLSAAVADFTPEMKFSGKMKKEDLGNEYQIKLVKTKDILAHLGSIKRENQLLVGFALESENEHFNAKEKMKRKNCDAIVSNSANKPDSGFGGDSNTISIFNKNGEAKSFMPMSKAAVAVVLINYIIDMILVRDKV